MAAVVSVWVGESWAEVILTFLGGDPKKLYGGGGEEEKGFREGRDGRSGRQSKVRRTPSLGIAVCARGVESCLEIVLVWMLWLSGDKGAPLH